LAKVRELNIFNDTVYNLKMKLLLELNQYIYFKIYISIMQNFKNYKPSSLSILLGCCFLLLGATKMMSQKNLAEKLGYAKDAKLLIIHADDLGVSHAENSASIKVMDSSIVNSASIMMPTPWVLEIADYAKRNNTTHDLGLHLVLTSEWKNYKWSSVAPKDKVPSLLNKQGYFYADCQKDMKPEEVEIELRAQIELAYTMGINPTHLDSHMGCLFWTHKDIFKVYLKLAQEYKLPCLVDASFSNLFTDKKEFDLFIKETGAVVVDKILTISPEAVKTGANDYYINAIKTIQPGLTEFLIHTAYDSKEMQAMTIDHPDWGATWRQEDYNFFMSDTGKKIIEEEGIILVTWREVSRVLHIK
jgi:predicted glycoside hydrolase/deacetylase ChbG (UPF0249 family)